MFDISGQSVASQEYLNGPWEDITDEFVITLLSLCGKRLSICRCCTHELKDQGAITAPPFDLVMVTKMWWDYYADGKKCQSAPSNVYFQAGYNNPFFTPFECIQRKFITFNVKQLQFYSHTYNHLTPVHRGMLRDLNLSHLLWKLVPFLTMFNLVLKLFFKFCWSVFVLLLLNFSRQYQLQRLSDISSPRTFTSVWNNCVCYYLPLLKIPSVLNYYAFFGVWNQVWAEGEGLERHKEFFFLQFWKTVLKRGFWKFESLVCKSFKKNCVIW